MRTVTAGAGAPPLFLVHGFGCDASDWQAQIDTLKTRTTVVACDLPGHGLSPGTPAECTIEAYGAAVTCALAGLKLPPAVLVGHSMGCRVVLEASRLQPAAVCALVLVDGSRIGEGDPAAARRDMADEVAGDGYTRFVRQFFESMFVPSSDRALAAAITDRALRMPAALGRSVLTNLAGWDAREVESALDSVAVPVLAIQSTAMDTARQRVSLDTGRDSPWLDLVRDRVPRAKIEILSGTGHFPQIEMADEVTALIAAFALDDRLGQRSTR